jgi:hypothetical protein
MSGMDAAKQAEMKKKAMPLYFFNFLAAFLQYYAVGFFGGIMSAFMGNLSLYGALMYGVFVWLGFIVPVQAGNAIWNSKSPKEKWQLFGITIGYQFVAMILAVVLWNVLSLKLM